MPQTRECDYCGADIEPGTGTMFVRTNGTTIHFCSSKCEKNADLGREARDLDWTEAGRGTANGAAEEAAVTDSDDEADAADEDGDAAAESDDTEPGEADAAGAAESDAESEESDAESEESDAESEDAEEPTEADA